ncbi:MAG: hypothetical protein QGI78_01015 [Phycisphaerales bacterium]|nr:hypothetical protein [Phycisphaerales bacterium]
MSFWAYIPQSVRVHPLSRIDGTELAVHITFTDGDGFACRGTGTLLVTISGNSIKDTLETVDLSNSENNLAHFDSLTRTYVLLFNNLPSTLEEVQVSAVYTQEQGEKLRATETIKK